MLDDEDSIQAAADALGAIGPDAKDAAPALLNLLDTHPAVAIPALGRVGADPATVVPALMKILAESNQKFSAIRTRKYAVLQLGRYGSQATVAKAMLEKMVADEKESCRPEAAFALCKIDQQFDVGIPILLESTFDLGLLRELGPAAAASVPQLVKSLADDDAGRYSQIDAAGALAEIDPQNSALSPFVTKAIKQEYRLGDPWSVDERVELVRIIVQVAAPKVALPILREALEDPSAELRSAAAAAIVKLTSKSSDQ